MPGLMHSCGFIERGRAHDDFVYISLYNVNRTVREYMDMCLIIQGTCTCA